MEDSALTLSLLNLRLTKTGMPPAEFNYSNMVFPPKGEKAGDDEELQRNPSETRPLNLKDTDAKLIAGAHVLALRPAHKAWSLPQQRGFVPDRQLANNITDADAALRAFAWITHLLPVALLTDIKAAFPHLSQKYLFLVMEVIGAPEGFRNVLMAL